MGLIEDTVKYALAVIALVGALLMAIIGLFDKNKGYL